MSEFIESALHKDLLAAHEEITKNGPDRQAKITGATLHGIQVPGGGRLVTGTVLQCAIVDKRLPPPNWGVAFGQATSVSDFEIGVQSAYTREHLNGCECDIGLYAGQTDQWFGHHSVGWDVQVLVVFHFTDGNDATLSYGQIAWGNAHNYAYLHTRPITGQILGLR